MVPAARLISLVSRQINWACFDNKWQYKNESLQISLLIPKWGSYFKSTLFTYTRIIFSLYCSSAFLFFYHITQFWSVGSNLKWKQLISSLTPFNFSFHLLLLHYPSACSIARGVGVEVIYLTLRTSGLYWALFRSKVINQEDGTEAH